MPGAWCWYAREHAADDEGFAYESPTREAAIAAIAREVEPGTEIVVVEARMSSAAKYEGADFVPFVKSRNREVIRLGPRAVGAS